MKRISLLWLLGTVSASLAAGCIEDAADPPHYGVYMAAVLAGEAEGRMSWGPAMGANDPQARVLWLRTLMIGPDLQPDFVDRPTPPFCMAFRWTAEEQIPNVNAADAGDVVISGYNPGSMFTWGVNPPPAPTKLPSQIVCQRDLHPSGLNVYGCNVDPVAGLMGPWITDKTSLAISAAGGANIGAFEESNIYPPPPVEPAAGFDLNQIDPRSVTAAWKSTSASRVVIELFAQLLENNKPKEFAQILCLEPASSRSKVIPSGALDVLPKPKGKQALMIQTSLLGMTHRSTVGGWGSTLIGVGRGSFGISCRVATGDQCPAPPGP